MPPVQTYNGSQVPLQPIRGGELTVRATPQAFGAGTAATIGHGLSLVSQKAHQISSIFARQNARVQHSNVLKALNEAYSELRDIDFGTDGTQGLLTTEGREAIGVYDRGMSAYKQAIERSQRELTTQYEREMYGQKAQQLYDARLDRLAKHQIQKQEEYIFQTSKASKANVMSAYAQSGDPGDLQRAVSQIEESNLNMYGDNEEVLSAVKDQDLHTLHLGRIQVLMEENPDAVYDYYKQHKEDILPRTRAELGPRLKQADNERKIMQFVVDLRSQGGEGPRPSRAEGAFPQANRETRVYDRIVAKYGNDPEKLSLALAANKDYALQERRARDALVESQIRQAQAKIDANPYMDRIEFGRAVQGLPMDVQESFYAYWKKRFEWTPPNLEVYISAMTLKPDELADLYPEEVFEIESYLGQYASQWREKVDKAKAGDFSLSESTALSVLKDNLNAKHGSGPSEEKARAIEKFLYLEQKYDPKTVEEELGLIHRAMQEDGFDSRPPFPDAPDDPENIEKIWIGAQNEYQVYSKKPGQELLLGVYGYFMDRETGEFRWMKRKYNGPIRYKPGTKRPVRQETNIIRWMKRRYKPGTQRPVRQETNMMSGGQEETPGAPPTESDTPPEAFIDAEPEPLIPEYTPEEQQALMELSQAAQEDLYRQNILKSMTREIEDVPFDDLLRWYEDLRAQPYVPQPAPEAVEADPALVAAEEQLYRASRQDPNRLERDLIEGMNSDEYEIYLNMLRSANYNPYDPSTKEGRDKNKLYRLSEFQKLTERRE